MVRREREDQGTRDTEGCEDLRALSERACGSEHVYLKGLAPADVCYLAIFASQCQIWTRKSASFLLQQSLLRCKVEGILNTDQDWLHVSPSGAVLRP